MKTFRHFLLESQAINLAKKAWSKLSSDAKYAIETWEAANWIGGRLEKSIVANDAVAQEILAAIKPAKDYLKSVHGTKIKLYRGEQGTPNEKAEGERILQSWTSERKVAEAFAGIRGYEKGNKWPSNLKKPITDEEIQKALDNYKKRGFTTFRNKKYLKSKEWPNSYDIYNRVRMHLTGDNEKNMLGDFKSDQEYYNDHNAKIMQKARVREEYIDIDSIVWITNNVHSKEYIVKVR